jgi:hypothetical protein
VTNSSPNSNSSPRIKGGKLPYIGDKVVLLTCTPTVREELRALGLEAGQCITQDAAGDPPTQTNAKLDPATITATIEAWLEVIRNEAAMAGTICNVWIPSGPAEITQAIRDAAGGDLVEISAATGAQAMHQIEVHARPLPDTAGKIFAVCSIRNGGIDLLPHWLEHYSKLGVDRILIGLFGDVAPDAQEEISRYAERWPFTCFRQRWANLHELAQEDQRRSACRAAGALPETWIIHSDLDELHEFPAPLPRLIAAAQTQGINAVFGSFIDRVTANGTLSPIRATPSLWDQFPVQCRLTERILRGSTRKLMLAHYSVPCGPGHHFASNFKADRLPIDRPEQYIVHHFKWHAELPQRLAWGLSQPKANVMWKVEAARFLNWIKINGGRINLGDPALGCLQKAA